MLRTMEVRTSARYALSARKDGKEDLEPLLARTMLCTATMLAAREVNIKKKLGARSERVLAAGEKFSETDTPKPSILSFVCQLKMYLKYT